MHPLCLIGIVPALFLSSIALGSEDPSRCDRTVGIYEAVSSPLVTDQNRGKPLHCSYKIRVQPPRPDWVVFVRFTRFRVGEADKGRRKCRGGYVQIVDGFRDSNHSNSADPGYTCGEIDSPRTFISETPHVKIVLHAEAYDHDTFLQFDVTVEQQQEVHTRYGQYAQLYPYRRGVPVPGTYCEKTFRGCTPTRCFLQSPGFPGIYPRNLRCLYSVSVSMGSAVSLDVDSFDVDGLRCDNLLLCFPRPVGRDCPYDAVRFYDGPTTESPLIDTLCGRGRMKSQIVSSGPEMLVEFISSPAGPPLNMGFFLKAYPKSEAEHESPKIDHSSNRTCAITRRMKIGDSYTFGNIRSWFPPNTTCIYKFSVLEEGVILKLTFDFFRVERVTRCEEALRVYDANWPDPANIVAKLCDMNRPRPKSAYETSGPGLCLEFISKTGSLEGSSLSYAFEVKAVPVRPKSQDNCNRLITPETVGLTGRLLNGHSLLDHSNVSRTCNHTFDASKMLHGRIRFRLFTSLRAVDECSECAGEHSPPVLEFRLGAKRACFCKVAALKTHTILSMGHRVEVLLHFDATWDKKQKLLVANGSYVFYSESRCGPENLNLSLQGVLRCPHCPPLLFCSWKIPVYYRMDLYLEIEGQPDNCTDDQTGLTVANGVATCEREVIIHRMDIQEFQVVIALAVPDNFTLRWTQLRLYDSSDPYCDFLCKSSMTCLTSELVCNGVDNCPGPESEDEIKLCSLPTNSIEMYVWIAGGVTSTCFVVFVAFSVFRRCRVMRHRI